MNNLKIINTENKSFFIKAILKHPLSDEIISNFQKRMSADHILINNNNIFICDEITDVIFEMINENIIEKNDI